MAMIKIYEYKGCGTCRNALKFLDENHVAYEKIPIREKPPTVAELKLMLTYVSNLKSLFNIAGGDYRDLNLKTVLPTLSEAQAIKLLSGNGNLVKRPFVLGNGWGLVGFKVDEWKQRLHL